MSQPPVLATSLAGNFHPYFRVWWGQGKADAKLKKRRREGHCTLAQYAVLASGGLSGEQGEKDGTLAIIFDVHFEEWLGEQRLRVFREIEKDLTPLITEEVKASRTTLTVAGAAINACLNRLVKLGVLPPTLPKARP